MRSIFAIWSDNGRVDYGSIARPRLTRAIRLGIATAAFAVAAVVAGPSIRNVYSEMVANYSSDQSDSANHDLANQDLAATNRDIVNAASAPALKAGRRSARLLTGTKPRAQLRTIGLAPIGAANRSTTTGPVPNAGSAANPVIAPVDHAQAAEPSGRGVAKLEENKKLDEKSRVAKRKPTRSNPAAQVYVLPDGRPVLVRPARENNFTNVQRFGRRTFGFGAPF
jgi:hypothetical protein